MPRAVTLPPRLAAIAGMCDAGTMCDIGCDHALLPVWLAERGVIGKAAACDINPGPLAAAARNIGARGLSGVVETRLGPGLSPIIPGEFEICVIAGMGGLNIISILEDAPDTAKSFRRLLLLPHRDCGLLRRYLYDAGFHADDEVIARDGGKYYNVMNVSPGFAAPLSTMEESFGRPLVKRRDKILLEKCEAELTSVKARLSGIPDSRRAAGLSRRRVRLEEVMAVLRQPPSSVM